MSRWTKPAYACVYSISPNTAVTSPQHDKGPVLVANDQFAVFGCLRCGLMFWEPVEPPKILGETRCRGYTVKGKRCRLEVGPGEEYCAVHKHQANLPKTPGESGTDGE